MDLARSATGLQVAEQRLRILGSYGGIVDVQLSQLIGVQKGELRGHQMQDRILPQEYRASGVILTTQTLETLPCVTILGAHRIVNTNEDAGGHPLGGNDRNKGEKSKEQAHRKRLSHRYPPEVAGFLISEPFLYGIN